MPSVFLSHSNQDSETTLKAAAALRRAGFGVWVDFENIRGGADWLCEIEAGIARCDAVVVVLSKASARSVWVERECLYAFQLSKPVFTALVADVLIPLHLINIQYCDLRGDQKAGLAELASSIHAALAGEAALEDPAGSSAPTESNFFPYLAQLPQGDVATMVARDLFLWSRGFADELAFGGKRRPGFQARIQLNGRMTTIFSVRAYSRQPAVETPLDRLARHKPFRRRRKRAAFLRQLNRLLPKDARFDKAKANGRPAVALCHLSAAKAMEGFKALMLETAAELREAAKA